MIFLAYNYSKYKLNTQKNIQFREFALEKTGKKFPGENILLPYSQNNVRELSEKLGLDSSEITGSFITDLPTIMPRCDKLAFFPTESLFIGSGVNMEIACARGCNLPVYGYNPTVDDFTTEFALEMTECNCDPELSHRFNRRVRWLDVDK